MTTRIGDAARHLRAAIVLALGIFPAIGCSLAFGVSKDDYARAQADEPAIDLPDAQVAPPPVEARTAHLYLIGGDADGATDDRIYSAPIASDGTPGNWLEIGHLPTPLQGHTAFAANGSLFVVGGGIGDTATSSAIYVAPIRSNGTLDAWNIAATLPIGRRAHSTDVYDGRVYVTGGQDSAGNGFDDVLVADLRGGSLGPIRTAGTLDAATSSHASAIVNGHLFVIGGRLGVDTVPKDSVLNFAIADDGSLGPFHLDPPLPTASAYVRAIAFENSVFLMGAVQTLPGTSPPNLRYITREVQRGMVDTKITIPGWSKTNALDTARFLHSCASAARLIYCSGGFGPNKSPRYADLYVGKIRGDLGIDWTHAASPLPHPLAGHALVVY